MFLTGKRSPFLGEMKNSVVKMRTKTLTTEALRSHREPQRGSVNAPRFIFQQPVRDGIFEMCAYSVPRTVYLAVIKHQMHKAPSGLEFVISVENRRAEYKL